MSLYQDLKSKMNYPLNKWKPSLSLFTSVQEIINENIPKIIKGTNDEEEVQRKESTSLS